MFMAMAHSTAMPRCLVVAATALLLAGCNTMNGALDTTANDYSGNSALLGGGSVSLQTPSSTTFSGLTFASGNPLNGFTLGTNTISGFTSSDVTSSGSTVFINLAGLPAMGTVVVDLTTGSSTSVPEPSSLAMLAVGLLGIGVFGLARRRVHSDLLS